MAYSFADPYRALRTILRIDGAVIGGGLGLLLLTAPFARLAAWGALADEAAAARPWPVRLAGALLIALCVFCWLAASERSPSTTVLVTASLANGLIAFVLLTSYLRGDLASLTTVGQVLLIIAFLICLLAALFPLQHLFSPYERY